MFEWYYNGQTLEGICWEKNEYFVFFLKRSRDIEDPICQTEFCEDGFEYTKENDYCGFNCTFLFFCSSCRVNNGTSQRDMRKDWIKKHGFKFKCYKHHLYNTKQYNVICELIDDHFFFKYD